MAMPTIFTYFCHVSMMILFVATTSNVQSEQTILKHFSAMKMCHLDSAVKIPPKTLVNVSENCSNAMVLPNENVLFGSHGGEIEIKFGSVFRVINTSALINLVSSEIVLRKESLLVTELGMTSLHTNIEMFDGSVMKLTGIYNATNSVDSHRTIVVNDVSLGRGCIFHGSITMSGRAGQKHTLLLEAFSTAKMTMVNFGGVVKVLNKSTIVATSTVHSIQIGAHAELYVIDESQILLHSAELVLFPGVRLIAEDSSLLYLGPGKMCFVLKNVALNGRDFTGGKEVLPPGIFCPQQASHQKACRDEFSVLNRRTKVTRITNCFCCMEYLANHTVNHVTRRPTIDCSSSFVKNHQAMDEVYDLLQLILCLIFVLLIFMAIVKYEQKVSKFIRSGQLRSFCGISSTSSSCRVRFSQLQNDNELSLDEVEI